MKRRLRKHPQHHPADSETAERRSRRLPYGLIWLVLTVFVLVLVIVYDRRSIGEAEAHITMGHQLETKGLYVDALNEYEQALENKRLGRKAKGDVALSMAEIYFGHMEDYPSAHRFYVQARQNDPSVMEPDDVQQRAKLAATRAKGAGVFRSRDREDDGITTQTIVQRVELLQMPQADRRGPVVALYQGGEIRAGQLLRALEKRPEFLRPDFREDPKKLEDFLNGILRETLAYEAAVSTGIQKDPDVSERLYDYQKSLVTQRYLVDRREQALVVDNESVEKYYREHLDEYVQPGQITVSIIKSDVETSAAEMLQMLRDGVPFEDVATSFSVHQESIPQGGNIGTLTEKDTTIKGVGEAPQVVEALFKLPVYSVSEVIPIGSAYYIFKIAGVVPARNTTLGEARSNIENILRGRAVDQDRMGLDTELYQAFEPEISNEGLQKFWDFARQENSVSDSKSTDSLQTPAPRSADAASTSSSAKIFDGGEAH